MDETRRSDYDRSGGFNLPGSFPLPTGEGKSGTAEPVYYAFVVDRTSLSLSSACSRFGSLWEPSVLA